MLETGSCLASNDGQSATMNPFTWAQAAHMIYLDESVDVGFSYADDGYSPGNHTDDLGGTARDIISALQLLYLAFPHILGRKLHLAGQSFAGRSLPAIAESIIEHNTKSDAAALIPLESIIVGNGVIHSPSQLPAIRDTVCAASNGLPALFSRADCDSRLASLSSDCAASQQACLDGRDPEGPMCSTAALTCENGILSAALYGRHDSTNRSPRCFHDDEYTRADDCGISRVLALHSFISAYGGDELLIGRQAARQHVYKGVVTPPSVPLLRETGSGIKDIQRLLHQNVSTLLYYGAYDILAAPAFAERALDVSLDGHVGEEWRASIPRDAAELGLGFKGSVKSASSSSGKGIIWFVQVDNVGRLVPSQSPNGALRLAQTWLHQFGAAVESESHKIIENEL
ncbi:hypothetical protein PFICI_11828 [Pestalotiopsis fici W106-1]|uniref:Uncharacterized protein n=1 Tax=Pestalotiopsis fici (strain W106-1 / CGMCC3.15140) TaxID=1229662 RepID=W3WUA8_PESFW|nr:uncharacterized protein PFICI_11828 [Pestalotiopsis fici W106-1]ETS76441.1 hypothetical protein PFICI_11828 [Pestalotiopsis fici W106-1]